MWFSIFRLKPFDNQAVAHRHADASVLAARLADDAQDAGPARQAQGNQPQQRRNPDGYSSRSASTGATLDARSAGSNDAASTVARDVAAAISSVRESLGAMP